MKEFIGCEGFMSLRKQFATVFSDLRDMPPSKHLASDGSPQARHCASLVRLGGELGSALGAFSWDMQAGTIQGVTYETLLQPHQSRIPLPVQAFQ